jgi:hypothetical protein
VSHKSLTIKLGRDVGFFLTVTFPVQEPPRAQDEPPAVPRTESAGRSLEQVPGHARLVPSRPVHRVVTVQETLGGQGRGRGRPRKALLRSLRPGVELTAQLCLLNLPLRRLEIEKKKKTKK